MLVKIFRKIGLVLFLLLIIYVINHLTGAGINHLEINPDELDFEFERVLFVPGINTPKFYLNRWNDDLVANFPTKEIIFLDEETYLYWQNEKTERIVEKGKNLLNDGKATVIIAHSYGGVLAETMIERAENANIVKLITMASPHQLNILGIDDSKSFLNTPENVEVPMFSFGGYIDPVVIFPLSDDLDDSEASNHQNLWSGHSGFLFKKDVRKQVLEYTFGIVDSEGN